MVWVGEGMAQEILNPLTLSFFISIPRCPFDAGRDEPQRRAAASAVQSSYSKSTRPETGRQRKWPSLGLTVHAFTPGHTRVLRRYSRLSNGLYEPQPGRDRCLPPGTVQRRHSLVRIPARCYAAQLAVTRSLLSAVKFCRSTQEVLIEGLLGDSCISSVVRCSCARTGHPLALKMYHKRVMTLQDCKQVRKIDTTCLQQGLHCMQTFQRELLTGCEGDRRPWLPGAQQYPRTVCCL